MKFDYERFALNRFPHPKEMNYLTVVKFCDSFGLDIRLYDTVEAGHLLAAVLREAWSRWPHDKGDTMNWAMGVFYEDNVKMLTRCVEFLGGIGERRTWEELREEDISEALGEIKRLLDEKKK